MTATAIDEVGVHDAAPDTLTTPGLADTLGSADHLVVGRLFVVASLLFLLVGRVASVLVGAEGIDTSSVSILDDLASEVFSVHLVADLFLFLVPAFLGLAIAVLPLQLGAATVAFPRAAAAAFWGWFLSAGVMLASYFLDGGPTGDDIDGRLLWVIGLGGVLVSLVLACVCVITTILALRTGGMGLDRVPMFAWGTLVAATVWLISLPVLVSSLVVAFLADQYGSGLDAAGTIDWAFGLPAAFGFALPVLGLLLDVTPVAAGARLRSRGVLLGAVALAGVLGFGADTLAGADTPAIYQDALYVGGAFALLLPLLAIGGGVADTLRRGKLRPTSPMLFALFGYLLFLLGAATNGLRVVDGLDLTGTSADSGVAQLAVVAGILGVAGGLHHWSTKIFGAELREGLGRLAALVLFLGGVVIALPDVVSGFLDQPRAFGVTGSGVALDDLDTIEALNGGVALGALLVLLGVLLVVLNVAGARSGGDDVPADPWDGHTLEWATASPPAPGGPGPIDPVTSAEPLLDRKEAAG